MASARDGSSDTTAALRAAGALSSQLRALEERAGISKQVQQAQRVAVDAMEGSDEHFADAKERSLLAPRQIYFRVPDLVLRKELIQKRRECDRAMRGQASDLQGPLRRSVPATQRGIS
jgi:hypothetical protein